MNVMAAITPPAFSIDPELVSGRKLAAADLRLLILSLLADAPLHGYEIIAAIQTRSRGYYRPSPGTVYPALAYIREHGQATAEKFSNRSTHRITGSGRTLLEEERDRARLLWDRLARGGRKLAQVAVDAPVSEAVSRARAALDQALRARAASEPDEERRIAQILNRAAAEILSDPAQ
jgi:DNA-binding PadR family transcriptional regulator